MLLNRFYKKIIAMLRRIAAESFLIRHLVHSLVHSFDNGRGKRLRYITDGKADNLLVRVCLLILSLLSCNG